MPEDWDDNTSFYRRSQRPVLFASQTPEARDERQRARVAALTAFGASGPDGSVAAKRDSQAAERVRDYERRVAEWSAYARRFRNAEEPWRLYWAMTSGHHDSAWGFVLIWLPMIVLWTALKWAMGATINQRLTKRLARGECPRCRYAIGGPLAVEVERTFAASCSACPECGYPWPMWPPGM